ncbi:hypothetical protein [Desulfamplus magnetovallimortis]|uniref:hypothetical protein n=1 Tax=Desulfamplus magnetovallimortis TaxID=1246637 RepID=UPI0009BC0CF3|nr:hypothetical protein [Desulfamplus magnetovallimortis]
MGDIKDAIWGDDIKEIICFVSLAVFIVSASLSFMSKSVYAMENDLTAQCIEELEGGIINWTTGVVTVAIPLNSDSSEKKDALASDTSHDFSSTSLQQGSLGNISTGSLGTVFSGESFDSNSFFGGTLEPLSVRELDKIPENALSAARQRIIQVFEKIASDYRVWVSENGYSINMLRAEIEKKALNAVNSGARKFFAGDGAGLIFKADIYGDFLQFLLPPELQKIPEIEVIDPANQYSIGKMHTGMVVDARDIGFKPVLYPLIVSEHGAEIYGSMFASREYAVEKGLCTYAYLPDPSMIMRRAGDNPVVIKALRKDGDKGNTIIIPVADAEKIVKMPERHLFMKACKVIILISKTKI